MNTPATPKLRVIALGAFGNPLPPLAARLRALDAQPLRASSLAQLPAVQPGDLLLTELDWLLTLSADDATHLGRFAAGAAAWVMLADTAANFKERIAWQRRGVTHCFDRPLDSERLAALVEEVHDRIYGSPLKVVLVDDDAASLALHGEMLRQAGCDVMPTTDPLLVLDLLDELRPDVLVVDIEMPACRGPELVALVRQRTAYARLPAIYLTAMESLEDKLHARSTAAEDFLTKPVEARLLVASVEAQGRRYRAWQREQAQSLAAQARERQKAQQLRLAIDEHAIVSITDMAGNILEVNDKFCEISGYRREELLGQNHRILKSGVHPPEFFREMWQTIAAGKTWHGELCNRHKDGHFYWVAATIVPICDSRGKPQQYISLRTDITRIVAERSEFATLTETMDEALYRIDAENRLVYVNPAFTALLGYAPTEALGRAAHMLFHCAPDAPTPAESCSILQTVRRGERFRGEETFYDKAGQPIPVEVHSVPLFEGDRYTGSVTVFHDLRRQREMTAALVATQETLQRQRRLLEIISRAQSQFIREQDRRRAFDGLLADLLEFTGSAYGFIGEVLRAPDGRPYLKTYALTNIAWDEATLAFYERHAPEGMEFTNLDTLFGAVLKSGEPVIANDPAHDPRRGGLPEGHPPLDAFLGLPVHHGGELVAMIGLANRPGGYDQALVDTLQPLLVTLGQLVEAARIQQKHREDQIELARLSRVASQTTNGVVITDAEGRVEWINEGFTRISGYTLEEMRGRKPGELLQGEATDPATVAEMHAALARREGFAVDILNYAKSGQPYWVRISCNPLLDADGTLQGFIAIESDITEEKRAADALRASEARLRGLFELSPIGIALNDYETGKFIEINDALLASTGYTREEFTALSYWDITPREYEPQEALQLESLKKTGRYGPYEKEYIRKDGSRYPVLLNGMMLEDPSGRKLIWSMIEDISERKRLDRMKSEFVSIVSHELRTPLTSIAGALGLIAGGALGTLPAQAQQMIAIAYRNSQRLTHLINDLLDMEKLAAGKMQFDMRPQALMPLIEQALEENRTYGGERGVTLVLTDAAPDVEVQVDAQRLLQVLANLLSNAIKFSPEGGVVKVSVTATAETVTVSIADQGPGIPAAFRERIFQKFSQADASDTRQKGGTGLGLAISRELVERMGGSIGFESEEGKGARFFFDLPVWRPVATHVATPAAPTDGPALPGADAPRILVVEDDAEVAQLLALMLSRDGYRVDVAGSGEAALAALQQAHYAAITLDLMLPDISGLEIIRRLRQRPETAELPIVVVSAKMEEGRLALNGDFSAIEWLAKPIDEQRLLNVVERLLSTVSAGHPRVLHIEDDADLHEVVRAMAGQRFDFELATTLGEARARLSLERFDVVILDIGLPDGSGWDLLAEIRARQPQARVVILSGAYTSPDEARKVEAVLLKSQVSPRKLLEALDRCIRSS